MDHVVVWVPGLERAIGACERAGFRIAPGGCHAGGRTANALIVFADGTYVELLTVCVADPVAFARGLAATPDWPADVPNPTPLDRRFLPRAAAGWGCWDLALRVDDVAHAIARADGVTLSGPEPGERRRPDGKRVAWSLGMPEDAQVPFLIEDTTPTALRIPRDVSEFVSHPNGVRGIDEVVLPAADATHLADTVGRLVRRPGRRTPAGRRWSVGEATLTVASGRGPYRVRFRGGTLPADAVDLPGVAFCSVPSPGASAAN